MGASQSASTGVEFPVTCSIDANFSDTPEEEVLGLHVSNITLTASTPDALPAYSSITIEDRCALSMHASATGAGVALQTATLNREYKADTPLSPGLQVKDLNRFNFEREALRYVSPWRAFADGVTEIKAHITVHMHSWVEPAPSAPLSPAASSSAPHNRWAVRFVVSVSTETRPFQQPEPEAAAAVEEQQEEEGEEQEGEDEEQLEQEEEGALLVEVPAEGAQLLGGEWETVDAAAAQGAAEAGPAEGEAASDDAAGEEGAGAGAAASAAAGAAAAEVAAAGGIGEEGCDAGAAGPATKEQLVLQEQEGEEEEQEGETERQVAAASSATSAASAASASTSSAACGSTASSAQRRLLPAASKGWPTLLPLCLLAVAMLWLLATPARPPATIDGTADKPSAVMPPGPINHSSPGDGLAGHGGGEAAGGHRDAPAPAWPAKPRDAEGPPVTTCCDPAAAAAGTCADITVSDQCSAPDHGSSADGPLEETPPKSTHEGPPSEPASNSTASSIPKAEEQHPGSRAAEPGSGDAGGQQAQQDEEQAYEAAKRIEAEVRGELIDIMVDEDLRGQKIEVLVAQELRRQQELRDSRPWHRKKMCRFLKKLGARQHKLRRMNCD